jgi:transcription elongation factor Elf1
MIELVELARLMKTLTLVRLPELLTFVCVKCGKTKTSKLVALDTKEQWHGQTRMCNGCYGQSLSTKVPVEYPQ